MPDAFCTALNDLRQTIDESEVRQLLESTVRELDALHKGQLLRMAGKEPVGPFYHGGPVGLQINDQVLPSCATNIYPEGKVPANHSRTFVTLTYSKAVFYAAGRTFKLDAEVGKVYIVQPEGSR